MEGVVPKLINVAHRALEITPVDFGIPLLGGYRTFEQQRKQFDLRRSLCDGRFKISPHQVGHALDFYALDNGKPSWNKALLGTVAAAFLQAGNELDVPLEWGGFWNKSVRPDMAGHYFGWDCGHIQIAGVNYGELYTRPQNGEVGAES